MSVDYLINSEVRNRSSVSGKSILLSKSDCYRVSSLGCFSLVYQTSAQPMSHNGNRHRLESNQLIYACETSALVAVWRRISESN